MNNIWRTLGYLFLQSLLVAAVILALSGGFCQLGGQCTPHAYGAVASNVGFVVLALGGLTALGITGANRSTNYQIARTASTGNIFQRTLQDINDAKRRVSFAVPVFGGGILALILGFLLLAATSP
jgi:hypothetical protein